METQLLPLVYIYIKKQNKNMSEYKKDQHLTVANLCVGISNRDALERK